MTKPDHPLLADQDSWTPLKVANAVLAFMLELAMLAALGYWGFTAGPNALARIVLAVGLPALAGVVWWLFLAAGGPRFDLPTPARVIIKLAVFGAAALALWGSGLPVLALIFGTLAILTVVVERLT